MRDLYVGKVVLYHHPKMEAPSAAIVTRVLPGRRINATVFLDSGRTFAVYSISSRIPGVDVFWDWTEGDSHA